MQSSSSKPFSKIPRARRSNAKPSTSWPRRPTSSVCSTPRSTASRRSFSRVSSTHVIRNRSSGCSSSVANWSTKRRCSKNSPNSPTCSGCASTRTNIVIYSPSISTLRGVRSRSPTPARRRTEKVQIDGNAPTPAVRWIFSERHDASVAKANAMDFSADGKRLQRGGGNKNISAVRWSFSADDIDNGGKKVEKLVDVIADVRKLVSQVPPDSKYYPRGKYLEGLANFLEGNDQSARRRCF